MAANMDRPVPTELKTSVQSPGDFIKREEGFSDHITIKAEPLDSYDQFETYPPTSEAKHNHCPLLIPQASDFPIEVKQECDQDGISEGCEGFLQYTQIKIKPEDDLIAKTDVEDEANDKEMTEDDGSAPEEEYNEPEGLDFPEDTSDLDPPMHKRLKTSQHSGSLHKCLHCQKLFDKEDVLDHHLYKVSAGPKEPHTCHKCGEDVKCRTHLWAHLLTHKGQMPHICKDCGMVFKREEGVKKHMLHKHFKDDHTCEFCQKRFESMLELVHHMLTHSGVSEPQYKCLVCSETFERKDNLQKHLLTHNNNVFACKVCLKAFDTKDNLSTHNCAVLCCNLCLMTFSSEQQLRNHRFLHNISGGEDCVCPKCGKAFAKKYRYIKHTRKCYEDGPFPCEGCNEVFKKRSDLTQHLHSKYACKELYLHAWTEHDRKTVYSCEDCKLDFKTWSEVVTHRRTHEFQCDTCMKKYKSKYMLSKHMEVCDRKCCTMCNLEFSSPSELAAHKKCHVFKCNNCSLAFEYKDMLSRHLKVCLKERCPCTECSLEFDSLADMHLHRRITHMCKCDKGTLAFGFRPDFRKNLESAYSSSKYKCLKCGKLFKIISDMMKHSQDAHKNTRPFECEKCGKRFRNKWSLTQHQANHCTTMKGMCNPCHLRFFTDEDFSRHMNTEHVVPCTHCSDSFRDASELEKHYAMKHNEDEMIVATLAEEIAESVSAASNEPSNQNKTHIKEEMKDEEQQWPSMFCDETFKETSEVRRHCMMKHQGVKETENEDIRDDLASIQVKKEGEEDGFGTEDSAVQQQDTDSDSSVCITRIWNNKNDGTRNIVRQFRRRTSEKPYAVSTVQELESTFVKKEPEDGVVTGNLVKQRWNNQVGGSCVAAALPCCAWNDQNSIARKNIRQYGRKANTNLPSTAVQKEPGNNPGPRNSVTEWCRINDEDLRESLPNHAWNDESNKNRARENVRQYGRKGNKNLANTMVKEEPEDKMENSVALPRVMTER